MQHSIAALAALGAICAPQFAAASNYFLDFNDNQVPTGWSLQATSINTNFGIANGRFYANAVDSAAYLEHSLSPMSASEAITVEWDGPVFKTYWGNFSGVRLVDGVGTEHLVSIGAATYNWPTDNQVVIRSGNVQYASYVPLADGDYHFKAIFAQNSISFEGSLNGVSSFSWQAAPESLSLPSIVAIRLHVYETVGPTVWMDNVSITAVPEASTTATLLLGLLSITARASLKRRVEA